MTLSDNGDEPPNGSDDEALQAAGTLLHRLIQAEDLTQVEIDAKLDFARGYVSRLIHGRARLTDEHIRAIREVIEVDRGLVQPPREVQAGLRELRAVFDRVLPPVKDPAPPREVPSGFSDQNLQERIESAIRAVRRNPPNT